MITRKNLFCVDIPLVWLEGMGMRYKAISLVTHSCSTAYAVIRTRRLCSDAIYNYLVPNPPHARKYCLSNPALISFFPTYLPGNFCKFLAIQFGCQDVIRTGRVFRVFQEGSLKKP